MSERRIALRRKCFWTSTRPTIPSTANRKAVTTTRLLPPAHVPSAPRLRWRERASNLGAFEGGEHPRLQLLGRRVEAHRPPLEAKMARNRNRAKGGRWLRRAGPLRLLRG